MQAEGNMFERVTQAYLASRGVRFFCVMAVVISALVLFVLAGGFPPYAWRLLFRALPQMPALLSAHGAGALLALVGVLLLSVTILAAWCALLWLSWKMLAYWRYERRELRRFAAEVAEAQSQADEANAQYEQDEDFAGEQFPDRQTSRAGGQSYPSVPRRRVVYPLAPLTPQVPEETYSELEESYSEEEDEFYAEEEEDEHIMSLYRDEEEDENELAWSGQPATNVPTPAPYAAGVPLYEPPLIEHSSPLPTSAGGAQADSVYHTSYGRILPFSAAPSVGALPHLTAASYNRVPLPTSEAAGSANQPSASLQAFPSRVAPTQPAASLQSPRQPAEPTQPVVQVQRVPQSSSPRVAPTQPGLPGARPTAQLPASAPVGQSASASAPRAIPARPSAPLSPVPRTAPMPVAPKLVAPAQVQASGSVKPESSEQAPTSEPSVTNLETQPMPLPEQQSSAMQSLVELISTVPLSPRARVLAARPSAKAEPGVRAPATQLIVSTGLDVGLKRRGKPNEDSLLALQNTRNVRGGSCPVGLFVVADGMGGHENGQEASHLVIQSLSKTIVPAIIYGPTDDNYSEVLAEGIHHANLEVYQRNRQTKADMGTTVAAALVVDTTAYIVSAGDSRVYLYRAAGGLTQVTRDHSTVARMVESGLLKAEDVYTHPRRNEIYRSLGHHPSEDLDKFILALQPDDVLLLCSDGLWEMVRDAHIQEIIASTAGQPAQTSAALVQAALDGGGKDNISVIVVYVKAAANARTAWAG